MSLFTELRRRHVFRTALAYLVTVALLFHVSELLTAWFLLPSWISKTLIVIAALGFPFALVFAWSYELTPDGIKHETEVDPDRDVVGFTGRRIDYWTIGALFVLLALSWKDDVVTWLSDRSGAQADGDQAIEVISQRDADYEEFKKYVKEIGLDEHWRENGFPPQCRPEGENDFECD